MKIFFSLLFLMMLLSAGEVRSLESSPNNDPGPDGQTAAVANASKQDSVLSQAAENTMVPVSGKKPPFPYPPRGLTDSRVAEERIRNSDTWN